MTAAPHIVLTGGSGFLGRHVLGLLTAEGRPYLEITRTAIIRDGIATEHHRDSAAIAKALASLESPVLVHLAAHFVSRHTPSDIEPLISGSVGFATLVFDGFFNAGGRSVVTAGSAWQFDDSGARRAANLYAALKNTVTDVLDFYVNAYGGRATELVLFDSYGSGDTRRKLIPLLLDSWIEGREFAASAGLQPINLTHANDIARAILIAANSVDDRPRASVTTRAVKSGDEMPVRELIELIQQRLAPSLKVAFGEVATSDAPRTLNRSIPLLEGWKPEIPLVDGLSEIFTAKPA